ncbi:422_t:CDS:1 [Ambispora leptoticha]|uniref:422_t:CDS:1 n=1 Tax=Ambispora leptoticha TaxID=144679 RepID=A0A9N8WK87_9GLOM|nr:422_t:CDS:1 [Ambispora leptoticha]
MVSWNSITSVFTGPPSGPPSGRSNSTWPVIIFWLFVGCVNGGLGATLTYVLYRPQWLIRRLRINPPPDNIGDDNSNVNNQNRTRRLVVERESWIDWFRHPRIVYNYTYYMHQPRCERCGGNIEPTNGVNDSVEPTNGNESMVLVGGNENF